MEISAYLAILRKRWLTIALVAGLIFVGAVAATVFATPTYTARSQVFVSVRTGGSMSDLLQGSNFTQGQVKSYTDLVTSPRVLIPVIENLNLPTTPDRLATSIAADSPLDTVLININVTDESPQVASDVANATAASLGTQVTALERPADGQSPVQISTVRPATVPAEPSSPNARLNLSLGMLLGLALGFALAVLREVLDTAVQTEADVQNVTDASVIASIGFDADADRHPLIVQSSPQSHRSEAFRRLRTNLQFLDIANRPKTIVLTSALPGEGKSTTAINLAITLADAGSHVALVDADLRRPSVAEYMGLESRVGLTTVLIGQASLADVVRPWGNGYLHILPSGEIPPNPSELLGSRSMARLLDQLTGQYDVVLLDAPPLLPVTDAAILASLTGGAIVVVGADKVNRQQLSDALGSLEAVGARVLGLVINRIARKKSNPYTYYDYHSTSPGDAKPTRPARPARPANFGRFTRPSRSKASTGASRSGKREATAMVDRLFGAPAADPPDRWPGTPLSDGASEQK